MKFVHRTVVVSINFNRFTFAKQMKIYRMKINTISYGIFNIFNSDELTSDRLYVINK